MQIENERPLLIHIGYHKTATTWLQHSFFPDSGNSFSMVPQWREWFSRLIEPHPFDYRPDLVQKLLEPELAKRRGLGCTPVISNERLSGLPHAGAYDSKTIADRLNGLFPSARVFITIREQHSMLRSIYYQFIRDGGSSRIETYLKPPNQHWLPFFRLRNFEYDILVRYYYELFSEDQVLVLPFEMFRSDPQGFLEQLAKFANTKLESIPNAGKAKNVSPRPLYLSLKRALNPWLASTPMNCNSDVAIPGMSRIADLALRGIAKAAGQSINRKVDRRVRDEIAALVGDTYAESNAIMSEMIRIDLRNYGYKVS